MAYRNHPVEFERFEESPPLPKAGPPRTERVYDELMKLGVGKAIDVSRDPPALRAYAQRLRRFYDEEARFVIRPVRPGWSRIWRIK